MSENASGHGSGSSSPDVTDLIVQRAIDIRNRLDPSKIRQSDAYRPLMIEMLGTVASGKTSAQQNLRAMFRRTGFSVSAPREGAEAIEGPRPLPDYNFRTFEYAMVEAHRLSVGRNYDVALFDRALYDGVVRMELYSADGTISEEEHRFIEKYMLLPHNTQMFDLHIFLVCGPETTLARKALDELIYIPGKTVNPDSLRRLYEMHRAVWDRLDLGQDPRFIWVDTDHLEKREVVGIIANAALDAFERKLSLEGR